MLAEHLLAGAMLLIPFSQSIPRARPQSARPDEPVREMQAAVAAASTLAYTAEFVREEVDLPTGERTTSSVRGQVWMERREVGGGPAATTAGLPWKIALSTVLDDDVVEFEGAVALWAYDGAQLCMLHPEKQRADVREPTPENLSILTGFARSRVLLPAALKPQEIEQSLARAAKLEPLAGRELDGVACRGVRLHFPDREEQSLTGMWTDWWVGADGLPRQMESSSDLAGRRIHERLTLTEVRAGRPIPAFVFTPEIPPGYGVPAVAVPAVAAPAAETAAATPATAAPPAAAAAPAVVDAAPEIDLVDASGVRRTLAARRGQVTVIDFWGTWCGPCRMALPHLDALAREHGAAGLEVWAVSCGEREGADPAGYVASRGLTLTVLPRGDAVAGRYGVTAYPTTFVIGRDGQVAFVSSGYSTEKLTELGAATSTALANP